MATYKVIKVSTNQVVGYIPAETSWHAKALAKSVYSFEVVIKKWLR
jgi:hypothetical protein